MELFDLQQFRNRLQQYKSYRAQNPGMTYQQWKDQMNNLKGLDIDNDSTYDYRRFYYSEPDSAKALLYDDPEAHFTDRYKYPTHPTFSEESIYHRAGDKNLEGGRWNKENKIFYTGRGNDIKKAQEYLDWADPGYKAVKGYQTGADSIDSEPVWYEKMWNKIKQVYKNISYTEDPDYGKLWRKIKQIPGETWYQVNKPLSARIMAAAAATNTILGTKQVQSDRRWNASYKNYLSGKDNDPQTAFFMSYRNQEHRMNELGYVKLNKDSLYQEMRDAGIKDSSMIYGPVRSAAMGHIAHGKETPIYLDTKTKQDNRNYPHRSELIPIINGSDIDILPYDTLRHAGNYPVVFYIHRNTGDLYIQAIDVNDYGKKAAGGGGSTANYEEKSLGELGAELLDKVGSPFVQTTGYILMPEYDPRKVKDSSVGFDESLLSYDKREIIRDYREKLGLERDLNIYDAGPLFGDRDVTVTAKRKPKRLTDQERIQQTVNYHDPTWFKNYQSGTNSIPAQLIPAYPLPIPVETVLPNSLPVRNVSKKSSTRKPKYSRKYTEEDAAKDAAREAHIRHEVDLFQSAMNQAAQPTIRKEDLEKLADKQAAERKDKFYPYKLMAKSLYALGKGALAGYSAANGIRELALRPSLKYASISDLSGAGLDTIEGIYDATNGDVWNAVKNATQAATGVASAFFNPTLNWKDIGKQVGLIGMDLGQTIGAGYDAVKAAQGYQTGSAGIDDLAARLAQVAHTDPNGTFNPYYDSFTDTYGPVVMPQVTVDGQLTWDASRKAAGRIGANAVREGMGAAFNVAAPIVAGAALPAISSVGALGPATDVAGIALDPLNPLNYASYVSRISPHVQELINASRAAEMANLQKRADYANQQYKIIERVMDDPSYMKRAEEAAKLYGDDYTIPYADMFMAYNYDPAALPNVQLINDLTKSGSMQKLEDGRFLFGRNPVIEQPHVAEHELNHFTDMLKSGTADAEEGNHMFELMSKDLTKEIDRYDRYYMQPTEQKAHMNQLREWMFDKGYIETRDQKVNANTLKKILKEAGNTKGLEGVERASKQFKDMKTYAKWFNTIPLIGTLPAIMKTKEN